MSSQQQKQKKRLNFAFTTVLVSSSLLLFMLGLWVNMMFVANSFSEKIKEDIGLTVFVKPSVDINKVKAFKTHLLGIKGVDKVVFESKSQVAEKLKVELGEDVLGLLDINPFFDSYNLFFKANFVEFEQIQKIEKQLLTNELVYKVSYDKSILLKINKNLKIIGIAFIGICVLFLFIAVTLIYNSIRLSVHTKRFSIRTMQLVGAKNWFIQKPFIKTSLLQGLLASFMAIGLNFLVLEYLNSNIPSLSILSDFNTFLLSSILIIAFGIVLSLISTTLAVKKYLHAQLADLYV